MNIIHQLLTRHIEKLESDSGTLDNVREYVSGVRQRLDTIGPDITSYGREFIDIICIDSLEEILGTDQTKE